MLKPDIEIVLSRYNVEYEFGSLEKAAAIKEQYKELIKGEEILEWELLHERPISGW